MLGRVAAPHKWTILALGFIALGLVLRVSALDIMEFKRDEVDALDLGMRLIAERPWAADTPWPRHGMPSSQQIANAPLFNWIVALFWAMTGSPTGATAMIGLVNAASLYPLWLWARRRLDERRALLVLAVVAVSPMALIFSRKLWAQNLLLPGLIGVVWAIEWLRQGRVWRAAILLVAAALVVGQLHQSGPIALAMLPIALALQRAGDRGQRRSRWILRPTWLEGALLVAALAANMFFWVPYWSYLSTVPVEAFANRKQLESYEPRLLFDLFGHVAPRDLFYSFHPDRDDFLANPSRRVAYFVAFWFGAPLFAYGLWRWIRAPLQVPVVGVWWMLVILSFTLARIPTYPFYVLILSPLPALLVGGAFDGRIARGWIVESLHLWRWTYVAALLTLSVLSGAWLSARGGSAGDYGLTYHTRVAQATAVAQRLDGASATVVDPPESLGAARPADCDAAPTEVMWLIRWIHGGNLPPAESIRVCGAWVGRQGRRVYQWRLLSP